MAMLRRGLRLTTTVRIPSLISVSLIAPSRSAFVPSCTCISLARSFASSAVQQTGNTKSFLLADVGEGIAECEIVQWFIKEGDEINEFDKVCEVRSDKATLDISSRFKGKVVRLHHAIGDMAKVGSPLIDIQSGDAPSATPAPVQAQSTPKATINAAPILPLIESAAQLNRRLLAIPAVRRLAKENNIELKDIPASRATGKDGRFTKQDILGYIKDRSTPSAQSIPSQSPAPSSSPSQSTATSSVKSTPISTPQVGDRREKVSNFQRGMIKSMTASTSIPHFGYSDEIQMNEITKFRDSLKAIAAKNNLKITFMPILIKAASIALQSYSILNSSLSSDQSEIIYHGSHNIGVAIDSPNGLIVPNIKNVQNLSIFEIAQELTRLQELAKNGRLSTPDLTQGTFTLSNIGTIGGTYTSPVLLPNEVAIGALGKIQTLPRFASDMSVYAAKIMQISWSADHRVIDGATMAHFSNMFKGFIENPQTMLAYTK
eukprot:TRINITY_DN227_c0_g1_i3.p1 TRINITY_DN227_c0_g1~~TRINITY_DN227_c0_g1_i3.p1  ORF type:complete len:488 (+),score=223.41 TRINITY_DN227_c0_g1_i3:137-1600(+)